MISDSALVTAPATDVLTLAEMKSYLRIDNTADDTDLPAYVKSATQRIENLIDQKLVTQTWAVYFDGFPGYQRNALMIEGTIDLAINELFGAEGFLSIPFGPLQSVVVSSFDDSDTEYVFASSNYSVDLAGKRGRIGLRTGASWPATVLRPVNGVKVQCVVGYGAAAAVPEPIKQAIKILTAKIYESRGDSVDQDSFKIPPTVFTLIDPYRKIKVGGC